MGFYLELNPVSSEEFAETWIPGVFWLLYAFAGFALACMGLAAYTLMSDLWHSGYWLDDLIVGGIFATVVLYIVLGIKLFGLRKFVRTQGEWLVFGFRFFGKPVWTKEISRKDIQEFSILNQRPTPNIGQGVHADAQYHIRGHWKLVARLRSGDLVSLDKHVDQDALGPLRSQLTLWLQT